MTRRAIGVSERPPLYRQSRLVCSTCSPCLAQPCWCQSCFTLTRLPCCCLTASVRCFTSSSVKAKSRPISGRASRLSPRYCCCCRWVMRSRWAASSCAACCSAGLLHREESRYRLAGRDVPACGNGAIVAVIGPELAGVAANMAGLLPADGQSPDSKTIIISLVTLGVTVFGSVLFRGFMAIIPILIGVLAGYALSFVMGVVDTTRLPRRTGSRCQPSTPRALNGSPFSPFCLPRWW